MLRCGVLFLLTLFLASCVGSAANINPDITIPVSQDLNKRCPAVNIWVKLPWITDDGVLYGIGLMEIKPHEFSCINDECPDTKIKKPMRVFNSNGTYLGYDMGIIPKGYLNNPKHYLLHDPLGGQIPKENNITTFKAAK